VEVLRGLWQVERLRLECEEWQMDYEALFTERKLMQVPRPSLGFCCCRRACAADCAAKCLECFWALSGACGLVTLLSVQATISHLRTCLGKPPEEDEEDVPGDSPAARGMHGQAATEEATARGENGAAAAAGVVSKPADSAMGGAAAAHSGVQRR
jgi:hypothetical protein